MKPPVLFFLIILFNQLVSSLKHKALGWQKNQTVKVQVSLPKEPLQQLPELETVESLLN